jgi:Flp pilus assembly protein TadG
MLTFIGSAMEYQMTAEAFDLQAAGRAKPRTPLVGGKSRAGQAAVEFAILLPLFLVLLFGIEQIAIIGGAAVAVNQAAASCARYASLNPSADQAALQSYLHANAPSLINDSNLQALTLQPTKVPRTTGTSVAVTVTYSLKGKVFLGSSFFGVQFPTAVTVTATMTGE